MAFYSDIYGKLIVLDDLNLDPSHEQVLAFMERHNYYNLIKSNRYFKGDGSCINVILYNGKYCFQIKVRLKLV